MEPRNITAEVRHTPGFVFWGLACLVIAVVGFWPSYVAPLAAGTYTDAAAAMPLHVVSAGLWVMLITSQPSLVFLSRMKLHVLIGTFGILVALTLVVTGVIVQIDVMSSYAAQGDVANAVFVPFFRLITLFIFAVCFGLAIAWRSRPDHHKRLMVLGTFSLLEAPVGRIFANIFGLGEISGLLAAITHAVLMVLFLTWDRLQLGRFHPVSLWGTIVITVVVFGTAPIAFTQWWQDIAARLAGLF